MKTIVAVAAALCFLLDARTASAGPGGPPGCSTNQPLQLTSVAVPIKTLPGGGPGVISNLDYDFTSSGGIFCIQGLTMDAFTSTVGDTGAVTFTLQRINGNGLSEPLIELMDTSGGSSPQEITLAYGHAICATSSVQFHATLRASSAGSIDVKLNGTAIILAAPGVTVTVN